MKEKDNNIPLETTTLIVNMGELILKGKNRKWFEDILGVNIRAKLHGAGACKIEKLQSRIILDFNNPTDANSAMEKLRRVFGISSLSRAVPTAPVLADIDRTVFSCLKGLPKSSFAVRAKRIDKKVPFTSKDINETIGGKINDVTGWPVDLEDPELTVWIDVFVDRAYVYIEKIKGAGGLPSCTGGRVACLISGGIDSPVAAWRMMRRGCSVDFIHFHSAPFTDPASIEKVKELVDILNQWQARKGTLSMVPFGNLQKQIVTGAHEKYRIILYRRFMVRMAEAIAHRMGSEALITGEALGQVASQTLLNMATVNSVAKMPILRPLIGMDKQEIVDAARAIGTYDLSIIPHNDCCQFFEPRNPATYTTPEEMTEIEKAFNVEDLVKEGLTGMGRKDIQK